MLKLGIIGAMASEVESLSGQMTNLTVTEKAGMTFYQGELEQMPSVVVQCGVGKVNAALSVQILCDCFGVTHVVNTGVAGSLDAKIDIGDFIISTNAIYHDFDCHNLNPKYPVGQVPGMPVHSFAADDKLVSYAVAAAQCVHAGHYYVGTVTSGDQFVCQKERKCKIIEDTGALCVEMEGTAIAHAAWCNRVPFVVIRAISDKADDSAEMDYPTFEVIAARRCAEVIRRMARIMKEELQ